MDGKTKICGLIGNPVEHSLSPLMHNFYARETGVNLAYAPFKVEEGAVEAAVCGAFALGFLGLNVTVPHKQRVMEFLESIDQAAEAVGAVNTLVRTGTGFKGYNTDADGLRMALKKTKAQIRGRECILLGAGGAAKAAAYVLAGEGAGKIWILNRNLEKARELSDGINRLSGRPVSEALALSDYGRLKGGRKYLALQCTSVGMDPDRDRAVIEDEAFYRMIHTGLDIVYNPAETKFMKLVKAQGGRAFNGLDMLLWQGIIAYELWNPQVRVSRSAAAIARRMMMEALGQCSRKSLVLIGFMGAGKSSVAKCYSRLYGLPLVDTDQRIEELAGMPIRRIFETQGEAAFRDFETRMLEQLLEEPGDRVISVGGGLPLREENRRLMSRLGTVVFLEASPETVLKRLGPDVSSRPMLKATDVGARVRELLAQRGPVYRQAARQTVDTNGRRVEEIAEEIHSLLSSEETDIT